MIYNTIMVFLFAYAIEEASSASRTWLVIGAAGLALAIMLRFLARSFTLSDRLRRFVVTSSLVLASSSIGIVLLAYVIHLPAAEHSDEFYPNLRQTSQSNPADK